jgi:hypothetical protein
MISRRVFLSLSLAMGASANVNGPLCSQRSDRGRRASQKFRNLDNLFEMYPGIPGMREVGRQYRRAWTRQRYSQKRLTGSFFWVPVPNTPKAIHWEVHAFFDCWTSGADYEGVWKHIQDSVGFRWGQRIDHLSFGALPHGRVCRVPGRSPEYVIVHGGDYPAAGPEMEHVRAAFNLSPKTSDRISADERMLPGSFESLFKTLGIGLQAASEART